MPRLTPAQFAEWCRKRDPSLAQSGQPSPAVERENTLHDYICKWCLSKWPQWLPVHSRMDKPSHTAPGVPDFIIFGPFPNCILIECKTKTGKQSQEQLCWEAQAKLLGWKVHIVRSVNEFTSIAETISQSTVGTNQTNTT